MGRQRGRSPRTPKGNDGGDDKEKLLVKKAQRPPQQKPQKPPKKEHPSLPPQVLPPKKVQWFRCLNPVFLKREEYPFEWCVAVDKIGNVDCCHDCGAGGFMMIDTNEVGRYNSDKDKEEELK